MDSNFVVSEIVEKLRQNHIARIDELRGHIDTKYNHQLSYYKVWDVKQKAITKIFGDWEESYQRLRKLLLAYLDQDSGTQYTYWTIPSPIDGTTLLRYVLPLASAIVDKESGASWGWFLECFRNLIGHVIPDEGICIISDRHKSIKCAIAEWPIGDNGKLQVHHRYCLRHVASNFNAHFDDPTLKALALKAGYATHEAKFKSIMQTIKDVEINALRSVDPDDPHLERYMPYIYLMSEDVEKWTQSHDGGRRYGAMTTNISECFNGILKGARGLPIAAMVEFTWCKLVVYF
ncbi:uncharacterized protein LOC142643959 [Castanea sativa]|uniref:uncharacterized protein LOC142643959 n=1 Tax=Castanea sativa TaxID=21020 RepID=UPI003F64E36D